MIDTIDTEKRPDITLIEPSESIRSYKNLSQEELELVLKHQKTGSFYRGIIVDQQTAIQILNGGDYRKLFRENIHLSADILLALEYAIYNELNSFRFQYPASVSQTNWAGLLFIINGNEITIGEKGVTSDGLIASSRVNSLIIILPYFLDKEAMNSGLFNNKVNSKY